MASPNSSSHGHSPLNPIRQPYYDSPLRGVYEEYRDGNDSNLSLSSGSIEHDKRISDGVRSGSVGGDFGPYSYKNVGLNSPGMSSAGTHTL